MKLKMERLKTKGLEIKRVDPKNDPKLLIDLAKLYAQVFSGSPWNEYTRCPASGKFYGKDTEIDQACPDCSLSLLPAYETSETAEYILGEVEKKDSVIFVGKSDESLVAFSWAYSYSSPEVFANEKYKTEEMKRKASELLRNQGIDGKFYYFSESGILEEFRGRGLTNDFYRLRLQVPKQLGLPVLVRTLCVSPIVVVANKFGFEQIMGPKPDIDKARKIIKPTNTIVNNFRDSEIENRVLFVLR